LVTRIRLPPTTRHRGAHKIVVLSCRYLRPAVESAALGRQRRSPRRASGPMSFRPDAGQIGLADFGEDKPAADGRLSARRKKSPVRRRLFRFVCQESVAVDLEQPRLGLSAGATKGYRLPGRSGYRHTRSLRGYAASLRMAGHRQFNRSTSRGCGALLPGSPCRSRCRLSALSRLGEHDSAKIARLMASYFRERDEFDPVTRDELLDRLRVGSAAVLDVRLEDESSNGHLTEARNIPLAQLERRLAELPPHQDIVAYCRGPSCVLLFEAVALLRQRGYRTRRLEDGFPEWKTAGLPTSRSLPP